MKNTIKSKIKNLFNLSNQSFACINCGNPITHLYEKINENLIKLTKCNKCSEIADKYIEFEQVTILIDSVLLSQASYRHIVYNSNFKIYWKLSLILLLLESFTLWRYKLQSNTKNLIEDFAHEKGFYMCCIENLIDCITSILILIILTYFFVSNLNNKFNFFLILCKGILLGSFSKFLFLPIMIWRDNMTELGSTLHYLLVYLYYLIATIHIHAAITNIKFMKSFFIISIGFLLKQFIVQKIVFQMKN